MNIIPQLIINSLFAGSVYALLGMSFNLIFGTTKFFNFAHGSYPIIGGYAAFYFITNLDWPAYWAIIAAVLITGILAVIIDKTIYLPLRKRKSTNTVKLVASIGIFTLIQALLAILFTSQFQTLSTTISQGKSYPLFSGVFTQTQLLIFISAIIVLAALLLMLKFTKFGKAANAVSDDEEVAKIVGINTDKIISRIFFIGATIAGFTGILITYDSGIQPTVGLGLLLKGVIAAIIGGLGSIPGAFLGAYLLGFVENFGIWKINGEWKDAIAFGLLILFLLFRPQGIIKK